MTEPSTLSSEERAWWSINVVGYGRFEYFGTPAEAEEMREHKADWEGGHGTKRKAKEKEIAEARAEVKMSEQPSKEQKSSKETKPRCCYGPLREGKPCDQFYGEDSGFCLTCGHDEDCHD